MKFRKLRSTVVVELGFLFVLENPQYREHYLTVQRTLTMIFRLPPKNQDESPKQISRPLPPIPAIKHWNPHDSSSAITLSTIVADNTDFIYIVKETFNNNVDFHKHGFINKINVLKTPFLSWPFFYICVKFQRNQWITSRSTCNPLLDIDLILKFEWGEKANYFNLQGHSEPRLVHSRTKNFHFGPLVIRDMYW